MMTMMMRMTMVMMWMMLSDLSLRASSLHRGSGRFSPALALTVRAMYNVYNKQQTQNTSYLTQMCWCGLEEMQFEVDDVQNSFVLWCGKDVQQYIRVQSGEFLLIRLSITAHRLAGGCWGFSHKYLQFLWLLKRKSCFPKKLILRWFCSPFDIDRCSIAVDSGVGLLRSHLFVLCICPK